MIVDKPAGPTSHDVVARLRRIYRQRRIGHAGTLDPPATGVLVCGLGRATRLLRFVQAGTKVYLAEVRFGMATDTADATGRVTACVPTPVARAELEAVVGRFTGEVLQVPPMVSAVQVGGRRLHELARAGLEVERPARRVRIDRIEVLEVRDGEDTGVEGGLTGPVAVLRVTCGSGTYIRSLAVDLGAALGGVAHLGALRRERVGPFTLAQAHALGEIEADPAGVLQPMAAATAGLPVLMVPAPLARRVAHGAPLPFPPPGPGPAAGRPEPGGDGFGEGLGDGQGALAVHGPDGELLAVYERRGDELRPVVVVAAPVAA